MLGLVLTVLLSIMFLGKSYSLAQYMSVLLIMCGLLVVTTTDIMDSSTEGDVDAGDTYGIMVGFICLIIG